MKKNLVFFNAVFILLILCPLAYPDDCNRVVDLYNKGTIAKNLTVREQLFNEALSLKCSNSEILAKIHNNLADTYEKKGKTDLAIQEYQKALTFSPELATSYFSLGDIYFGQSIFEYAIENYERGLSIKDDEIAKDNLEKARQALPLYRSKNEIVASLSVKRTIRQVPSLNLYFGFNKAVVTEKPEKQLDTLLKALSDNELKSFRFRLTGHTCSMGSEEYNKRLSEERANAVKKWLGEHGFPQNCLETAGFGEEKPIEDNASEEGRQLNRRVEIRTTGVVLTSTRAIHVGQGIAQFNEGRKYQDQDNYQEAAKRFEEAYNVFEKSGDKEGVRATLANLAIVYRELNDDEKVADYLRKYENLD